MDVTNLNTYFLTHTAIQALKNAYRECTDNTARESIITAFKAIIQMQSNFVNSARFVEHPEDSVECDPSEYCAAV